MFCIAHLVFPLRLNMTCASDWGTRTVYVALDTAVYCHCFMPMDDVHDIEKEVAVMHQMQIFYLPCLHHSEAICRALPTSATFQ